MAVGKAVQISAITLSGNDNKKPNYACGIRLYLARVMWRILEADAQAKICQIGEFLLRLLVALALLLLCI